MIIKTLILGFKLLYYRSFVLRYKTLYHFDLVFFLLLKIKLTSLVNKNLRLDVFPVKISFHLLENLITSDKVAVKGTH